MSAIHTVPVKAMSKSYGYSVMIVKGALPSYIKSNPFFWYRFKKDAQAKCDYINATGRV